MDKIKSQRGFTLVEVIVVSVIVAVLAAVAIPTYIGYVRNARLDSARSCCQLIATAIIQTHNRGLNIGATAWSDVGITNASDASWTYTFPAIAGASTLGSAYAITATGTGPMTGKSGTYLPMQSNPGSRWTGDLQ
jgi:type IV pilus assembly protein PilE